MPFLWLGSAAPTETEKIIADMGSQYQHEIDDLKDQIEKMRAEAEASRWFLTPEQRAVLIRLIEKETGKTD